MFLVSKYPETIFCSFEIVLARDADSLMFYTATFNKETPRFSKPTMRCECILADISVYFRYFTPNNVHFYYISLYFQCIQCIKVSRHYFLYFWNCTHWWCRFMHTLHCNIQQGNTSVLDIHDQMWMHSSRCFLYFTPKNVHFYYALSYVLV